MSVSRYPLACSVLVLLWVLIWTLAIWNLGEISTDAASVKQHRSLQFGAKR